MNYSERWKQGMCDNINGAMIVAWNLFGLTFGYLLNWVTGGRFGTAKDHLVIMWQINDEEHWFLAPDREIMDQYFGFPGLRLDTRWGGRLVRW